MIGQRIQVARQCVVSLKYQWQNKPIFYPPILDFMNTEGQKEGLDKMHESLSNACLPFWSETIAPPQEQARLGPIHIKATFV